MFELESLVQQMRAAPQVRPPAEARNRLPQGYKATPLPAFGGAKDDDVERFLFQAEDYFDMLEVVDPQMRIRIVGQAFKGAAADWYRSVRSPDTAPEEQVRDWETLKSSLRAFFRPTDPVKLARDKLHDLRQSGSVRDYTARFRQLCTTIGSMSEDEKLHRYVHGLKQVTQREVDIREPTTFAEAVKLAERVDRNFDRAGPSKAAGGATPMDLSHMERVEHSESEGEDLDLNYIKNEDGKAKYRRLTDEQRQHRRAHGLCMYCGEKGHLVAECPTKKSQGKGGPPPKKAPNRS
jgi:hypothetical protein